MFVIGIPLGWEEIPGESQLSVIAHRANEKHFSCLYTIYWYLYGTDNSLVLGKQFKAGGTITP